ncbi:MAG: hypothetical protein J1E65_02395 [Lachnospiraceae bacterium]|nr:hypothetical protein [Lachnospiraceae bacterium]
MKEAALWLKRGMAVLAALSFFGILYPQLCVLEDTCKVVYQNASGEMEEITVAEGSELYYQLLSAEPEEIKIKSRLWELISAYFVKD